MIKVCAHYCGTVILLDKFDSEEEANDFMKNDYVLAYADELENEYEDEVIHPYEMFIDESEDIPFCEPMNCDFINSIDSDELPF